jgi:uncharacterized protein (DUF433 family)
VVYLISGEKMQEKKQARRSSRRRTGRAEGPQIVRVPGMFGGSPVVDGMRVRVLDVVRFTRMEGDARIALPFLTKEQIRTALDYYEEHKEEIDAEDAEEKALAQQLARQWRPDST